MSGGVSRRGVLLGGGLAAGLAAGCSRPPPPEPAQPPAPPPPPDPLEPRTNGRKPRNVIVIYTDDQRYDSFGFAGHPLLETPNFDRLAAQGAVARESFVTTSLCCPSRASLLTGLYAHAHGVLDNTAELDPALPTFPAILRRAGITTAWVGKWHMGAHSSAPRPNWDHWVSFRGQGRYTYPGPATIEEADRRWNINGEVAELDGYVTDLVTDQALAFLASRDKTRPYCLVVSHKACHAPFEPPERHRDRLVNFEAPAPLENTDAAYEGLPIWLRRQRDSVFGVERLYDGKWANLTDWYRDYHRTLFAVDESVGRILEAIQREESDTLVLFTSDNGFMIGEKGVVDKRCFYEPSIRVPLLAWAPGAIAPGTNLTELLLNIDVPSTILDALGLTAPDDFQGRSFLPMLYGERVEGWRQDFLYEYFFERSFPGTPTVIGLRGKRAKLSTYHGVWEDDELYDLEVDPEEKNNLAGNAKFGPLRKDLATRLRQRMADLGLLAEPVWGRRLLARSEKPAPKAKAKAKVR